MDQTAIIERLTRGAETITSRLPEILGDPRAYPRESMLLALIAALVIVLLVLIAFVVSDVIAERRKRRKLGVRVRRPNRVPRFLAIVGIVGTLGLILALAPAFYTVSAQCTTCHELDDYVASWESGSHPATSCYGCHAEPGVMGIVQTSFEEVGRMANRPSEDATITPRSSSISNAACLRCHDTILDEVIGESVRMRHSDVQDAGYACVACHATIGHEPVADGVDLGRAEIDVAVMSLCLRCHDDDLAPADCLYCHTSPPMDRDDIDVEEASAELQVTCEGCHTAATDQQCIECHGLELPHPEEFMPVHAAQAWDDPQLCGGCHEQVAPAQACGCHGDVNLHGTYEEWFPLHGQAALVTSGGGCNCHDARFCAFCHVADGR